MVRLWDGNHSNLGSNPNRTQRTFAQIFTFFRCHYYVVLRSDYYVLLQIHYCKLLRIITYSNYYSSHTYTKPLLRIITYSHKIIITYYNIMITNIQVVLASNRAGKGAGVDLRCRGTYAAVLDRH